MFDNEDESNQDDKIEKYTSLDNQDEMGHEDNVEKDTSLVSFLPKSNPGATLVNVKDDQLYVAVKDHGIGMLPEQLEHVFDKFYRVEETSQRFQGLGIGLYISSEIIKRHGGEIGVKSTYGKGSEFYFIMPTNLTTEPSTN